MPVQGPRLKTTGVTLMSNQPFIRPRLIKWVPETLGDWMENCWGPSIKRGHKVFLNGKRHGLPANILEFSALLQEGLTWASFFNKTEGCLPRGCTFIKSMVYHRLFWQNILFRAASFRNISICTEEANCIKHYMKASMKYLIFNRYLTKDQIG